MKKILLLTLFALSLFGIERFCYKQTRGFRIWKIQSVPFASAQSTEDLFEEREWEKIEDILSKPFTYLGSGGQTYVFASSDGKYVLKFIKKKIRDQLPFLAQNQKNRLEKVYRSFDLAWSCLKEQTGLVYLHLTPNGKITGQAQLTDAIGCTHLVKLDKTAFAVQKRVPRMREQFHSWMANDELQKAKDYLSSLVALFTTQRPKGIEYHDVRCNNLGLLDGEAILFDLGSFCLRDPEQKKVDLHHELRRIDSFFQIHSQELQEHLEQLLSKNS